MCEFTSRNDIQIKNHLVEHVNKRLPTDADGFGDEVKNKEQCITDFHEAKEHSISDDYDENGRLISESDTDSDTDGSE